MVGVEVRYVMYLTGGRSDVVEAEPDPSGKVRRATKGKQTEVRR